MIVEFGQGTLWATRTDIANATPTKFGALQDVSVEFAGSTKELYGKYQFPIMAARGSTKITGKAKFASIDANVFFNLFFGVSGTMTTGQTSAVEDEAHLITTANYGGIEVTATSAAYDGDLGVIYQSTRLPFQFVTGAPIVGEYALATGSLGSYAFAAGDAGATALISYLETVTGGQTITMGNPQQGQQPIFSLVLEESGPNNGGVPKGSTLQLFAAISSKLSLDHKLEDFVIPELDFSCFANAANQVFQWSFSEVS